MIFSFLQSILFLATFLFLPASPNKRKKSKALASRSNNFCITNKLLCLYSVFIPLEIQENFHLFFIPEKQKCVLLKNEVVKSESCLDSRSYYFVTLHRAIVFCLQRPLKSGKEELF